MQPHLGHLGANPRHDLLDQPFGRIDVGRVLEAADEQQVASLGPVAAAAVDVVDVRQHLDIGIGKQLVQQLAARPD
jgi:hypothetical protein